MNKKIMLLIPCLMLENNRDINRKSMKQNWEQLNCDELVCYDQMFNEEDKNPDYTYIGHADKRMGWVEPRNKLLEYFYNSDYDYALWIDANSTVSGTTLNDARTIIDNVKAGNLEQCDAIFATLGMWVSSDRIQLKKQEDYLDTVHLIPVKLNKSYNWMHGLIHKNYKKYYGQEFYIDERCDTRQGTPDDVYFARVLRRFSNAYVAPTVVYNKPSSKMSCTWANEKGTYDYPPVLFDIVDNYIYDNQVKYNWVHCKPNTILDDITLKRVDYKKELIKPYKSKAMKIAEDIASDKVDLF